MNIKLGIDLGTSNVVVATIPPGIDKPYVYDCWEDGSCLLPSYVWLESEDNPIVGKIAKDEWERGAENCYRRFKLDMGRGISYAPGITPERLTQHLIEQIKNTLLGGEQSVGEIDAIDEVVVTVPHGWLPDQREATKKAVTDAGLKVKELVSEPVAAAAYYSYFHKKGGKQTTPHPGPLPNGEGEDVVLVCDIGGGTFDISLVRVLENRKIEVIDSERNEQAGMWADALIAGEFAREFNERSNNELNIPMDERTLLETTNTDIKEWLREANNIKESLNNKRVSMRRKPQPAKMRLNYGDKREELQFSYEQLENALTPLVNAGKATIKALLDANPANPPDAVIMAGGMGKMQIMQEMVADVTGYPLEELMNFGTEADRAIARGAALVAYDKVQIQEVLLHSIGIATPIYDSDGRVIVDSAGKRKYENTIIVKKGTPIPFEHYMGEVYFETTKHGQDGINVTIAYGEDPTLEDYEQLIDFSFRLPVIVPKGERYQFWFSVDKNGIVTVGVEGKGISGEVWQGEILRVIKHELRRVR
jgi:molecular chaperone DnaK (HSP70)